MGTLPDAVVLCVNPFDDRDYIRRTIQFIESATEGKVIALCLFPMELKSETLGAYGGKRPIALGKTGCFKAVIARGICAVRFSSWRRVRYKGID